MGRPLPIPRYLAINWWWLLVILGAESTVSAHFKVPVWVPSLGWVWVLLQAWWLKRAEPGSRATYFYLGSMVVSTAVTFFVPEPVFTRSWHSLWVDLCYLFVGVINYGVPFVFRAEMQVHFRETEPRQLNLNRWMTFFFNTLYFQYWFHQLYVEQNAPVVPVAPIVPTLQ